MKLTEWFPLSVPPVRPGSYEIKGFIGHRESWRWGYYNGEHWSGCWHSPEEAYEQRESGYTWLAPDCEPKAQWRGLAEKP